MSLANGEPIVVIVNPRSGGGVGDHLLALIQRLLPTAAVVVTKRPGDATRFAEQAVANGVDAVVAAGGDGTIHEVLNGLYRGSGLGRVALGVLPLGTGNDLARTLELPADPSQGLALIARGERRACDVGLIEHAGGTSAFLNVATFGLTGRVSEKMTPALKRGWGPLSYARAALESLSELTRFAVEVTFDDEPPIDLEIVNLVAANGRFAAAGVPVAPKAELNDGLLDVLLFSCDGLPDLIALTARVMVAHHLDSEDERILYRRVRRLTMRASDRSQPIYADGEKLSAGPFSIEILPSALELVGAPLVEAAG